MSHSPRVVPHVNQLAVLEDNESEDPASVSWLFASDLRLVGPTDALRRLTSCCLSEFIYEAASKSYERGSRELVPPTMVVELELPSHVASASLYLVIVRE